MMRGFSRFCYGATPLPVLAREDDVPMLENARHCRLAFQESKKISENGTRACVSECVYCLSSSLLFFCELYAHILTLTHIHTHISLDVHCSWGLLLETCLRYTHTHTHPTRE